jgi:hypothetical protein
MAIKLAQKPKFTVKNIVIEIANEAGGWDRNTMEATFDRVDTVEAKELAALEPKEVLVRKMTGWHGVVDDDGQQVPFNVENLTALLLLPPAVAALNRSFWEHQVKARSGN